MNFSVLHSLSAARQVSDRMIFQTHCEVYFLFFLYYLVCRNGRQLVQVNVIKYSPSFSVMALRTGMVEVKELNGLLCFVRRDVLVCTQGFVKRHCGEGKTSPLSKSYFLIRNEVG